MDAHAVVGVLQATEVLVWSWSQHPPIVLPVDVEDALVPGLVLVDLPAMEGIVINIITIIIVITTLPAMEALPGGVVETHPIPLDLRCLTSGCDNHLGSESQKNLLKQDLTYVCFLKTFEQHSTACRFNRSQWKVSLNKHT